MALPRKQLIQMSGAPGSGKSTMARLLAQAIDAVVINHDLIKSSCIENGVSFELSGKMAYGLAWSLAKDMIEQGHSVIFDSVCNYDEVIERGTALSQLHGYDYRYVECRLSDTQLLDQRLRQRSSLRSQRTAVDCPPQDAPDVHRSVNHHALFEKWQNPRRPTSGIIVVDSARGPEDGLAFVLSQLALPAAGHEPPTTTHQPNNQNDEQV